MASGLRIGRYELGERLGTGGFGVVYHARDTELGRELAIKVLRPEFQTQQDVIARFLKEARAAAKIDHPGIVTVFECGTISESGTAQDGNAYIAMELLRGQSLQHHLEKRGRFSVTDAILIARQVASALSVAHAAGIVHRDLKPDNVFLLSDSLVRGGYRVKILDFGVAKLAEPKEVGVNTNSQVLLGTPKYMSPEQARSARTVDHRTDIYTLGCMLYEMVTGESPYEGPGAIDLIIQHTTAPVPAPRSVVNNLPASLDKLIQQMLGKEPDERPQTMTALDATLEAILNEPPPVPARPKPPTPAVPRPRSPTPPTGLTPTPSITAVRTAPRPTPPPVGPPPTASATIPDPPRRRPSTPPPIPVFPAPRPPTSPAAGTGTDVFAAHAMAFDPGDSASMEQSTVRRPPKARAKLYVPLAIVAAGIAVTALWFIFHDPPTTQSATVVPVDSNVPSPIEVVTVDSKHTDFGEVKEECLSDERGELWSDLKDCTTRLEAFDKPLADALRKKADDEAANAKKYVGLQQAIQQNDLEQARTLVKRIGEGSVYSQRAHKALDNAVEPTP